MTIDLSALILATDEAATAALAEAQQPVTIDPDEVDRILASLPAKAAESLKADPNAREFNLWTGKGPSAMAFGDALHARIAACLGSGHARDDAGNHRVYLPLSRVTLAAQNVRSNRWIADVRAAWTKRGGVLPPHLDVVAHGASSSLVFLADGVTHVAWIDLTRSPADVVEEAATALRLPLWTIDGLQDQWRALVSRPGLGDCSVTQTSGHYRDGVYRGIPCLAFATVAVGSFAIDLDDARNLDAATLIARAADALALTVAPAVASAPVKPVNVATIQQETAKVAPVANQGQGNRQQGNGKPGQGGKR